MKNEAPHNSNKLRGGFGQKKSIFVFWHFFDLWTFLSLGVLRLSKNSENYGFGGRFCKVLQMSNFVDFSEFFQNRCGMLF